MPLHSPGKYLITNQVYPLLMVIKSTSLHDAPVRNWKASLIYSKSVGNFIVGLGF